MSSRNAARDVTPSGRLRTARAAPVSLDLTETTLADAPATLSFPSRNVLFVGVPTANRALTLPTSAVIQARHNLQDGESIEFTVQNNSAGSFAWQVTNSDLTELYSSAVYNIAQHFCGRFRIFKRVGAATLVLQLISKTTTA